MSVFFNGRLWTTPATMSLVDDSAMFNKNPSVGNVLAVIGRAEGGKPMTALAFGSADEAAAVLRGGESLEAIVSAFDPSAETAGPATVIFVRVDPAVQSSIALLDSNGATVINLLSESYGKSANGIKIKVESGSTSGKKLTTMFGAAYFTEDNVARNALSVAYVGAGAAATVSVAAGTVTLRVEGAVVATIDLNDYPTIQRLADRIDAVSGFDATVLDGNGEKPALNGLDFLADTNCKTSAATLTANLQAVVDWINSTSEGFVSASRPTNVGTMPVNVPYTYLTGGSNGVVTNTEWASAFEVLQKEDVQWVVPVTPTPAIHAMADAHCAFMSNVARMERRAIVGTSPATADDEAILAAKALNSDRTSLVHIGFYDYNAAGDLTLYPPYRLAALLAGMFSGVNPGTALTNKSIKVRGLERKLRNPTDTDKLIKGGVLCVEDTPKGYKVVKSISTWLTNNNYNRVEVSCGVATDYTARAVREAVDEVRGKKGNPQTLAEALSRADSTLRELSRPEPMGIGVLVGDAQNPAFRNLTASLDGDVLRVEFECSPVIPINYIPIVIHSVPYSGSASA